MKNEKRDYVAPDTEVKHVEIESAICSGSVDMEAQAPGSSISPQEVNTEFGNENNFGDTSDWSNLTNN